MFHDVRLFPASLYSRILLTAICLVGATLTLAAQQIPQAVQTGPVVEPRSAEKEPAGPPIAKGKQAITRVSAKCSTTLFVNADALFQPTRWTLNPDAAETMDVLGPMIAQAGKHPARIESFTDSAGSEQHNQYVSQKRAITVRGWLANHDYLPASTPAEGLGDRNPVASTPTSDGAGDPHGPHGKDRIAIVIDTCSDLK